MILFVLHQLWRLALFVIGFLILDFLIETLWPEYGSKLAALGVSLLIYCLMAYFVIPALFRLYHLFIKHDHIPLYATYGDGWASDPVNIALIVNNKAELQKAMHESGWYEADKNSLKNNIHEGLSIVFNLPYPNAPVSKLYLFNRRHDVAFQIPTNGKLSARTRHHVRFWRLDPPVLDSKNDRGHFSFWSTKLTKWIHRDKEIWIGASTEDFRPIDIRWRTGSLTHAVRKNADDERDFIIKTLTDNKFVKSVDTTDPGEMFKFRGQSFRTVYTTDGSIKVVHTKNL